MGSADETLSISDRVRQSSVKVPEGVEGQDWLAGVSSQQPEDDFWAFQQLCQTSLDHDLVSPTYYMVSPAESTEALIHRSGRVLARWRETLVYQPLVRPRWQTPFPAPKASAHSC